MLPLLVPAGVFLFALLVIYGLSRIYLELNEIKVGDVSMATPLGIGVAIAIMAVSAYLASRPIIPRWQIASIVSVAVVLLTGGAIWAAVHEGGAEEPSVGIVDQTPSDGGKPVPGAITVALTEFEVAPGQSSASAGTVTFSVSNQGNVLHNLRVIRTELSPEDLPVDEGAFMVDEDQVDVIAGSDNLDAGASETVTVDLEPGSYVLICNIPTHYESGMRAAFTIE